MDNKSRTQFGLDPCRLGWHDISCIGNIHNLAHRDRIQGECGTHLSLVNTPLQLAKSTESANEIDTLAGAEIAKLKDILEYQA